MRRMKNKPITAGIARLKIHNKVLAEKTIILYEVLTFSKLSQYSKTYTQTEPRTAISVMVIKGIIVMTR